VIAHVGGVPIEESLPSVTVAEAGLAVARRWIMLRRDAAGSAEHDSHEDAAHAAHLRGAAQAGEGGAGWQATPPPPA
jgi:hypothetical protein